MAWPPGIGRLQRAPGSDPAVPLRASTVGQCRPLAAATSRTPGRACLHGKDGGQLRPLSDLDDPRTVQRLRRPRDRPAAPCRVARSRRAQILRHQDLAPARGATDCRTDTALCHEPDKTTPRGFQKHGEEPSICPQTTATSETPSKIKIKQKTENTSQAGGPARSTRPRASAAAGHRRPVGPSPVTARALRST